MLCSTSKMCDNIIIIIIIVLWRLDIAKRCKKTEFLYCDKLNRFVWIWTKKVGLLQCDYHCIALSYMDYKVTMDGFYLFYFSRYTMFILWNVNLMKIWYTTILIFIIFKVRASYFSIIFKAVLIVLLSETLLHQTIQFKTCKLSKTV